MNRRSILKKILLLFAVSLNAFMFSNLFYKLKTALLSNKRILKKNDLLAREMDSTFDLVLNQILPKYKGFPGVDKIKTKKYIYRTLSGPEASLEVTSLFEKGLDKLTQVAKTEFKSSFHMLSHDEQLGIIVSFQYSPANDYLGKSWMSLVISLTLESVLVDPVYGGNSDQLGWEWLQHQPGIPRPSQPHDGFIV